MPNVVNQSNTNLRPSRMQETRETEAREYDYKPPSTLPDLVESDDWVYRWISTSVVGMPDDQNVARRLADQWEFVPYTDKDKVLKNPGAFPTLTVNKTGLITIGASSLGRMPRVRARARDAYYRDLTRAQLTGVKQQNRARFEGDSTLDQNISVGVNHGREVQFG